VAIGCDNDALASLSGSEGAASDEAAFAWRGAELDNTQIGCVTGKMLQLL
jgi:hypothetical protein